MFEIEEKPVVWPLAVDSWGKEELATAITTLLSERLTMGERVHEFEREFAAMHGKAFGVMTNSGSSANLLAVGALQFAGKLPRGSTVLVPAIAWSTTYAPLQQYGLKLHVIDVEPGTLNMDMDKVQHFIGRHIRGDTKFEALGLVGVSILGNPAKLREMRELADGYKMAFLEDNCESLGAWIGGDTLNPRFTSTGTFGDISTFSTFFSHHINTIEGGMLLTDDPELHELAVCLRAHGWTRDLPPNPLSIKNRSEENGFPSQYHFFLPGYNVRPTELAAAVGLVQLQKLGKMNEQRRRNASDFTRAFMRDDRFELQKLERGAVPFGFTMICQSPEARELFVRRLTAAGIETRLITGGAFHLHDQVCFYDYSRDELPNAERAHKCGFFLGNHPFPLTEQIAAAKAALGEPT